MNLPYSLKTYYYTNCMLSLNPSCECGLVAMTILVMEEISVIKVVWMAAMVVDMVAVGMATMDLEMTEAILEVVAAIKLLATAIIRFTKGEDFGGRSSGSDRGGGHVFAKSQNRVCGSGRRF